MKKILALLLIFILVIFCVACSNESNKSNKPDSEDETDEEYEFVPGLYETGSVGLYASGVIDPLEDKLILSWKELIKAEMIYFVDGMVYTKCNDETGINGSSDALAGDLILPVDGSVEMLGYVNYEDEIAYSAFTNCKRLTGIYIPASVSSFGDSSTFEGCISLTNVLFHEESTLTEIPFGAFRGCSNLVTINIPDSVEGIRYYGFKDCVSLTAIEFGEDSSLRSIQEDGFAGCIALRDIKLPDSLKSIDHYVFKGCKSLISITLPSGVTSMGERVFQGCEKLERVIFTGDAPYMENRAFENMELTVFFPSGNATWTETKMKDYGGSLTWISN